MLNLNVLEMGWGIVSSLHFVYDFQEKCFVCYILLTDQISLPDCLYLLIYCQYVCCNCLLTVCDIMAFEMNLIFLIKSFF